MLRTLFYRDKLIQVGKKSDLSRITGNQLTYHFNIREIDQFTQSSYTNSVPYSCGS